MLKRMLLYRFAMDRFQCLEVLVLLIGDAYGPAAHAGLVKGS